MDTSPSYVQRKVEAVLATKVSRSDAEGRRHRILAAAVQECSDVGYGAASMAGVARRANVSTATMYRDYKNKDDLLEHGLAFVVPLLAEALALPPKSNEPYEIVLAALINHANVMNDPFLTWLFRHHANTANNPQFSSIARAGRSLMESHWSIQLRQLENDGLINVSDHMTTINLLLGPIERRTVTAQLLFGKDDGAQPNFETAARFAAMSLFVALGTPKYHANDPGLRERPI